MTSTGCVGCGNEATSDFEALREDFYGDLMCPQCYDDDPHFYHKDYGKLWEVKCNNCDNVNWEEERPKNPKGYRCDDCGIADEQIAFDCHTCGRGVVRDSEEHDHSGCDQDNDDNWYCRKCYKDFVYKFRLIKKWCGPECDTKNCEGYAAKNIHWPISKGGEFWTLCNVCYEIDQDDGELKIPRGYTRGINGKLKRKKIKIIFN